MRTKLSLSFAALTLLAIPACAVSTADQGGTDQFEQQQEQADSLASTSTFYIVTRHDDRKCMYPMCGGWYVKRVNKTSTKCSDGSYASECYVADIDVSGLGLDDTEQGQFSDQFTQGFGLVRGDIVAVDKDGISMKVSTLKVMEGWTGHAKVQPVDPIYRVTSRGIQCFAYPCPSFHEAKLDTKTSANIADVDLWIPGLADDEVSAGYDELFASGILASGYHVKVKGPGGKYNALVADEYYTRAVHHDKSCGGFAGPLLCMDGQICDIKVEHACKPSNLPGVCTTRPTECVTGVWAPQCGCDDKTYGNECERLLAGVEFKHEGPCE